MSYSSLRHKGIDNMAVRILSAFNDISAVAIQNFYRRSWRIQCQMTSKIKYKHKHRDSINDWRDSCEIKMNNLEFSQLLINLKI